MIEQVARAICKEECFDDGTNDIVDKHWKRYKGAAKAAIEAMLYPTENMLFEGQVNFPSGFDVKPSYKAMINEALEND